MKKKTLLSFLFLIIAFSGVFMVARNVSAIDLGPFMIPNLIEDITGFNPSKFVGNLATDWVIVPALKGLLYIVGAIAAFLFWVGAQLIAFFMSLNMAIFDMPLVEIGWRIVRDIANLGFVLAIIIIAIATIVRYEEYGTKKLLPKLIAAAILVNFSLTIGAVFIDFSNTLTNFFISKSSSGGDAFGLVTNLANGFAPQKLLQHAGNEENFTNSYEGIVTKGIAAVISLFAAALFTFISALSLLGIAIMLLVRFMYLSVLLLVSPIIYLFWVIPDTQSVWKSWWNSFLKWVFNAPILTSFLYLTVISTKALGDWGRGFAAAAGSKIYDSTSLTPEILIIIGNSIIMTGLLIASLTIANSLGIAGATTAYSLASKAGKSAKGWALNKSKNTAKSVGRKMVTTGMDAEGKTRLERLGAKYGNNKYVGRIITGISGVSSGAKATEKKSVDEYTKEVDKRTGDDAVNIINRAKTMTDGELAAWSIKALKEGKLEDIKKNGDLDKCLQALRKTGSGDKVIEAAPQLAGMFVDQKDKDKVAAAEAKATMKLNEVPKNMDNNFLERNAKYLNSQMIDKFGTVLGKKGDDTRDAIKRGLEKDMSYSVVNNDGSTTKIEYNNIQQSRDNIDTLGKQIEDNVGKIRTEKAERDKTTPEIDKLKEEIRNTANKKTQEVLSKQLDRLVEEKKKKHNDEISKFTKQIEGWGRDKTEEKELIKDVEEELKRRGSLDALKKLDKIEDNPNYK